MQEIGRTILVGTIWAASMRWGTRLIGLAGMVVLARLLRPEDFGIIALASIVVGLLDVFLDLGVGIMLIRTQQVTDDDLNTAWTLRIIQTVLLAIAVNLAAPFAAEFFREPRIVEVIYVTTIALAISGFENIGMILVRKELRFARDFWYQTITKLGGTAIVIALALALRSYWALAIAQVVGATFSVGLSYAMHPYRPRLRLVGVRKFLSFSVHVMLINFARFSCNKADAFVVGRVADAAQMGIYNVASELSSMPPRELMQSVGRALFPTLAKLRTDLANMRETFLHVLASVTTLAVPMGAGIWAVADDLVWTVLGPQWQAAGPLMGWLAVYGTVVSLFEIMTGHVLILTDHERRQTAIYWTRLALLLGGILAGVRWGVEGIAIGATISGCVALVVATVVLNRTIATSYRNYLVILWRPLASALMMIWVLKLTTLAHIATPLPRLAASVVLGVLAYGALLLLLWWASGRPAGPEATVIRVIPGLLRSGRP